MTNTAANAAPQTPAADAAAQPTVSKMAKASKIFDEVFSKGYDLAGKTQRACFIGRAMEEIPMSKSGANTYYQNLSNKAQGKGLYKYNKYESKSGKTKDTTPKGEQGEDLPGQSKPAAPAPTKAHVADLEAQANKTTADLTKRWIVKNEAGEVVDSFSSRAQAKAAAVEGLTWADSQAK